MIVKQEFPPNWEDIKKVLPNVPESMIFTFGDTIYNPSGNPLPAFLLAHEAVHCIQQGASPRDWWQRYLIDDAFRAAMEIPAYQTSHRAAKEMIKDRNTLNRLTISMAMDLCGPAYGEIMTFQEAMEAIKSKVLYTFKV